MNEESIRTLLNNIKECDSLHNNCDYLLEHDESYMLVNYIDKLQQERDKYKSIVDRVKEFMEEHKDEEIYYYQDTPYCFQDLCIYDDLLKEIKELEEGNSNE